MAAFLPWLIPAGIQAGSSALKYLTRKKSPSFRGSAYGRYLKKTGQEGRYSASARQGILGQVSSRAGNVAGQERARTRGYLEAKGLGGSIAGVGELAKPGLERQRIVAGASERLNVENELSKQRAQEAYAMRSHESRMQRAQEEQRSRSELFGGLAGAAVSGGQAAFSKYRFDKQTEMAQTQIDARKQAAQDRRDFESREAVLADERRIANPYEQARTAQTVATTGKLRAGETPSDIRVGKLDEEYKTLRNQQLRKDSAGTPQTETERLNNERKRQIIDAANKPDASYEDKRKGVVEDIASFDVETADGKNLTQKYSYILIKNLISKIESGKELSPDENVLYHMEPGVRDAIDRLMRSRSRGRSPKTVPWVR